MAFDPAFWMRLTPQEFALRYPMADDEADVNDANNVYGHLRVAQQDASIFADTFEAYRQQGRDEVLREIAKLEPTACDSYCTFCRALLKYHEPDCLWLRAQQAVKT